MVKKIIAVISAVVVVIITLLYFKCSTVFNVIDYTTNTTYAKRYLFENFKGDHINNCYLEVKDGVYTAVDVDGKTIVISDSSTEIDDVHICYDILTKREFYILSLLKLDIVNDNLELFSKSALINKGSVSTLTTPIGDDGKGYDLIIDRDNKSIEVKEW